MLRRVVGGCFSGCCQRPIVMRLGLVFIGPWGVLIAPQGIHGGPDSLGPFRLKTPARPMRLTLAGDCGNIPNAYIYYAMR